MPPADFPTWYGASIFGGIGCALLSALSIAGWSLWRREGGLGRVIAALLVCVIASACDIGPLLWIEYRLNVYGPTLSMREVSLALAAGIGLGWVAPLTAMSWFILMVAPTKVSLEGSAQRRGTVVPAAWDDPARSQSVKVDGTPWAQLTPLTEHSDDPAAQRPVELIHALTLIGREPDNDIILDDDRISRRHAELRWDRGRIELADYGSMNGTLVNSHAARGRLPLRNGDIIDLGKRRYQLTVTQQETDKATSDATPEPLETVKTKRVSAPVEQQLSPVTLSLIVGAVGQTTTTWNLQDITSTIGRDPTCQVILSDASISRRHAHITRQPTGYFLTDLQSSNGVAINGHSLAGPTQLSSGDVITVGDCLLRFEEAASAGERVRPTPTPRQEPSFHMRIHPTWQSPHTSRPRVAPPRLSPKPREE